MKLLIHFLLIMGIKSGFSQSINPIGSYTSASPKKYHVTLSIKTDSTYNCTVVHIKTSIKEEFHGKWKYKNKRLRLYNNNGSVISAYKLKIRKNQIIGTGAKIWGRLRIFPKKKYRLKKDQ